ncbi:IclR family transcriptional regulator [Rhodobacteraceae bacterium NNCM2]|nr:IclR family transcriptional regulator [Coraliihabitans acroporae]
MLVEATERMPTNLRLLKILEVIATSDRPLSAMEVNEQVELPRPTIHRLCQTLQDEGYVVQEPGTRKLRPSRRMRSFAAGILNASHIHIARHQIMKQVASALGETVNFVVPEAQGMRYLDRVETDWPLRVQLPIGTHVPFHCTASGKCFLASMNARGTRRFLATLSLTEQTSRTQTDVDKLAREVAVVRRLGFSTDHEEFIEHMSAVAVPVISTDGYFVAALAAHGPSSRLVADKFEDIAEILKDGAERIARDAI